MQPAPKTIAGLGCDGVRRNLLFLVPICSFSLEFILKSIVTLKLFGAVEEVLPFTDFIPTATLAW